MNIKTWWNEKRELRLTLGNMRNVADYWQRKQEESEAVITDLRHDLESALDGKEYNYRASETWKTRAEKTMALLKEQKAYTMKVVEKLSEVRRVTAWLKGVGQLPDGRDLSEDK